MNATVRDVARKARVSAMTVSRVINGSASVRPETKRRVERAIAELDYVPNSVARGLMSSKTGTLGLIVPDIANPFFTMIVRGAETVARRAGYRLLLCNSENDLAFEREYVEEMISHRVEGLLIAPVGDKSKANLLPLIRREFPFVIIDRSIAGFDSDLVQADSVGGAKKLVSHLISIGHRRIAMITQPGDVSTGRDRSQGYREALEAAGIAIDPAIVIETPTADRDGGYRVMKQVLALDNRPTAVFAINNLTALGAIQVIREAGMVVPDDMGLACFDDVEHLAVLSPFLTVMNQPTETFGTVASMLLLDRIGGRVGDWPRRVILQADLIVRVSCGAKLQTPRHRSGPPDVHTQREAD